MIDPLPTELLLGLAVGAVGLLVAPVFPKLDWGLLWTLLALAGLYWFRPQEVGQLSELGGTLYLAPVVVVVMAGAGAALFRANTGEGAWMFLVSIGGAWATVPDTEAISILLGSAFPLAIAAFPLRFLASGPLGGGLAGLLGALVVISEAGGRGGSVVGAAGALAVAALPGRGRSRFLRHVLLVALWSRIAGRLPSEFSAFAVGTLLTLLVLGSELLWRRYFGPAPRESGK